WTEYHAFIDTAKARTTITFGGGLYLDMHGHGHEVQRLELGYLLTGAELALTDAALEAGAYETESSVRALVARSDSSFANIVRGAVSLGGLLAARGYRTVPSPAELDPGGAPYYSGGYSTARHGSRDGGSVSAIQVEANWEGVRDTQAGIQAFADSLASALVAYFEVHFGSHLAAPAAALVSRP
ncbi:MAG: N-formylglutamate amidohydrolase, partial [Gemmatimonadota bacterium]|nr:N-formylglutamate amidohydrolase [Gemmatimonadota bacterium]